VLETLRNTALPLFMANVVAIMEGPAKKDWLHDSLIKDELEIIRKQLKGVALEVCLTILDVAVVKHVNVWTNNNGTV
jgi:hypothetical protein